LSEILKQQELKPVPFHYQIVVIFAATNGYFDSVKPDDVQKRAEDLLVFMHKRYHNVLEAIQTSGELPNETVESLKKAIEEFNRVQV
jgi:F-type H+-transporting ATPase subunit alpha